jgi:hypothetical protein
MNLFKRTHKPVQPYVTTCVVCLKPIDPEHTQIFLAGADGVHMGCETIWLDIKRKRAC